MKYPYRVIKNNILYRAGEDVPEDNEVKKEEPETVSTDDAINAEIEKKSAEVLADFDAEVEAEKAEHNYTRTEINRMNTASLHELAKTLEIEGEADKSGAQLKADIIEKLGL